MRARRTDTFGSSAGLACTNMMKSRDELCATVGSNWRASIADATGANPGFPLSQ